MHRSATRRIGSHITSARSTLLRRTSVLAVIAAAGAVALSVGAAPASAQIRFCSATVCIGSGNGCSVRTSTGVVIEADDGDSFVDIYGRTWKCVSGKWQVSSRLLVVLGSRGPVAGVGEVMQGPPPADPCDISPTFRLREVGIADCQSQVIT